MQWVDACLFHILTRVVDYTSDLLLCASGRSRTVAGDDFLDSEPNDLLVLYNENIVAPAISCILYRRGLGGKVVVVVWQVTASTGPAQMLPQRLHQGCGNI